MSMKIIEDEKYSTLHSTTTTTTTTTIVKSESDGLSQRKRRFRVRRRRKRSSDNDKKMKNKNRKKWMMFIGFVIVNNVLVLLINVIVIVILLLLLKLEKEKKIGVGLYEEINIIEMVYKNKYQMFYHQMNDNNKYDDVIEVIIELDLKFDGDFYHFELNKNGNGNGVIVKMESDGDLYKICVDQCNCYVECQYNDDCNNGFVCNNYICVVVVNNEEEYGIEKRRNKETEYNYIYNERKVAQIIVAAPLSICIFGIFSMISLAVEYGEKYFIEECEKECPSTSQDVISLLDTTKLPNKKGIYHCEGTCIVDKQKFFDETKQFIEESNQKLGNEYKEHQTKEIIEFLTLHNIFELIIECASTVIKSEIISDDMSIAAHQFALQLKYECEKVKYQWENDISPEDEKGMRIFSEIHDFGIFHVCKFDMSTIQCAEGK